VEGAGRREAELISSGLTRQISANEKTLDLLPLVEHFFSRTDSAQQRGQLTIDSLRYMPSPSPAMVGLFFA
jgi:hypothetical protein